MHVLYSIGIAVHLSAGSVEYVTFERQDVMHTIIHNANSFYNAAATQVVTSLAH